jgi:hypothetical protein
VYTQFNMATNDLIRLAVVVFLGGFVIIAILMATSPILTDNKLLTINPALSCIDAEHNTASPSCVATVTAYFATATAEALPWWQRLGH